LSQLHQPLQVEQHGFSFPILQALPAVLGHEARFIRMVFEKLIQRIGQAKADGFAGQVGPLRFGEV
jgi:hypothetical protein